MVSAVLFITFFVLLVLNVPISVCLGLSSAAAILYSGTSLTIVATNIYSGISKFLLLAIPFFVLSGNIMAKAGISTRLIRFVDTCVGHRKGGIANVCIIVACFFGAISGSGPATVAALGAVLIPAMVERGGFSAAFSTALMATSSSIAIVIPPSIAFVVYASITGVSIGDMFMAGIIPGILMGLALVVVVMLEVRRNHVVPSTVEKASAKERWNAFKDAFWGFLMPVIILGGIYGGIFTPTEAAAVSVVYGLFVGMIIYKEVKFKDLWEILIDSAKTTGGIMLIVACASLFSFVCTRFGISTAASELLARVAGNQFTFLLICNIIFLIAGCFIDANSAMYIFIPIMLPVCKALGYNVIAFGIMATVNLAIGQVTPPVGVNLFVAIGIKLRDGIRVTLQEISRAVVPMVAASIVVLLIITYIPQISTCLPAALGSAAAIENGETAGGDSGTTQTDNDDFNTIGDYSDLDWADMTWNFTCSTTETSTWAQAGRKFGELMEQATGGKVKVDVYAADQLTGGNQSEVCVGQGNHKHNPAYSNWYALDAWVREYGVLNGIALTDAITTDCFLRDFQLTYATLFSGVRHDSGDPVEWGEKMIAHYQKLGINPAGKTLLFSDSLDFARAHELYEHFRNRTKVAFGIGTYISNDTEVPALNIVMKTTLCNGMDVAKISDTPGKGMCKNPDYVHYLKRCIDWRMNHDR